MSLINDALKKAQRLRAEEATDAPPVPGGGPRPTKRSQPRSAQSLVLLVGGGVALIALSVVVTVLLVSRKSEPTPVAPTPAAKTKSESASLVANTPLITVPLAPKETPPEKSAASTPESTKAATEAAPPTAVATGPGKTESKPAATLESKTPVAPLETPAAKPANSSVAAQTPVTPAPEPTPVVPPKTDERVHAFVDAVRVSGIRSSGGESRVLMNDRVYRVNDIVERSLGVRLTKVDADSLTFTDANGAVYVKYF